MNGFRGSWSPAPGWNIRPRQVSEKASRRQMCSECYRHINNHQKNRRNALRHGAAGMNVNVFMGVLEESTPD